MSRVRTLPTAESLDDIRHHCSRLRGLYAPSLINEAALLLDAFLDTAEERGHARDADGLSRLITAAAEATSSRHRRPPVARSIDERNALGEALKDALTRHGLILAPAHAPGAVAAVEPVQGGPGWGLGGLTGLAVMLYLDGNWDLAVNRPASPVESIYAPATPDGAHEVATIVHDIIHGRIKDPFR